MDRTTQLALNAINLHFYDSLAEAWSATRRTPWPGFARVLAHARDMEAHAPHTETTLRVLDLGSGDGRFAAYLHEQWQGPMAYLGVDGSRALHRTATERALPETFRFMQRDFVAAAPEAALPAGPFDLIVLFGVLHHVAGKDARKQLMAALTARLAATGIIALTIWRLPNDPRFETRVVPWHEYNAKAQSPLALEQLEPGDTLLRWGNDPGAPYRYCHFPGSAELDQLLAGSGLRVRSRFLSDGRQNQLNEYVLLET